MQLIASVNQQLINLKEHIRSGAMPHFAGQSRAVPYSPTTCPASDVPLPIRMQDRVHPR